MNEFLKLELPTEASLFANALLDRSCELKSPENGCISSTSSDPLVMSLGRVEENYFRLLMERHRQVMSEFISHQVGEACAVPELFLETHIAAGLALWRYPTDSSFLQWLKTVAVERCSDWHRRRQVKHVLDQFIAREADENSTQLNWRPRIDPSLQLQALEAGLRSLSATRCEPASLVMLEALAYLMVEEGGRDGAASLRCQRARVHVEQLCSDLGAALAGLIG